MELLIFVLIVSVISSQKNCLKYACNSTVITKGICAIRDVEGFNLTRCGYGFLCVPSYHFGYERSCVETIKHPNLYPGDHCEYHPQCLHGSKCINNICKGKEAGKICYADGECDVELYCNETCKRVGDSCDNGERCASHKVCHRGKCILLGTLANGQSADIPEVCASYYIDNGKCSHGLHLLHSLDCPEDEKCQYGYKNVKKSYNCICGMEESGVKYCAPGVGDIDTERV